MRTPTRHLAAYTVVGLTALACASQQRSPARSAVVASPERANAPLGPQQPAPAAAAASESGQPPASGEVEQGGRARTITDDDVARALRHELIRDDGVPAHAIDIDVKGGVVELSGTVGHMLAEQRAVEIAQAIAGVRSVVNRVEIQPEPRQDYAIKRDVLAALRDDPAVEAENFEVKVDDGEVQLSGSVHSFAERELARAAASGVRGVTDIDVSSVPIEYAKERSDQEIANDVQRRLEMDTRVDAELIDVAVEDGVVALTGTVGSAAERRVASLDAWVTDVENVRTGGLKVEWWARDKMVRKDAANPPDDQVRQAVLDAFLHDPRVVSFRPDVHVRDGVVTLTGTVPNLIAKRAAERDAENTVGVWQVHNLIQVRPEEPASDEELEKRIAAALERNPYVGHYDIGVEVHDGVVFLHGNVSSEFERRQAELVPALMDGVVEIKSALAKPSRSPVRDDWEIESEIERRLWWNPYVVSDRVNVDVDAGVATLAGTVQNYRAYNEALEVAYESQPERVNNQLRVERGPEYLRP